MKGHDVASTRCIHNPSHFALREFRIVALLQRDTGSVDSVRCRVSKSGRAFRIPERAEEMQASWGRLLLAKHLGMKRLASRDLRYSGTDVNDQFFFSVIPIPPRTTVSSFGLVVMASMYLGSAIRGLML